jgi:hypothetical protein
MLLVVGSKLRILRHVCGFHCCPKNIKIKIHRTIVFPVVLCGREACSATLREERRLRLLERRKRKEIFGLKRDEVTGEWRDRIERSFVLCTPYHIFG